MKTAVGETLLIGMALSLWADPWPSSGSAFGRFPVSVVVELGNDTDSLEQNVLVDHKRSSSFHFGVAHGHFFSWVGGIRMRGDLIYRNYNTGRVSHGGSRVSHGGRSLLLLLRLP